MRIAPLLSLYKIVGFLRGLEISENRPVSHCISLIPLVIALYLASKVDKAIVKAFFDFQ